MDDLVYINGEVKPYNEAYIAIEDRGYNFSDGVYEVVAIYDGRPLKMEEHFIRLEASARALEINFTDYRPLMETAQRFIEQKDLSKPSKLYIQISRGTEPRSHAYSDNLAPNVIMTLREFTPHPTHYYTDGCRAIIVPDERWPRCYIKSIALLPNIMAKKLAKRRGAFEAIQVRDGFVTEGASSNLFIVKDGAVYTPPASNYILNGITRQVILSEVPNLGIKTLERSISLAELFTADEVFLTGTTTEVMPVVDIDDKVINTGKPGPITTQILAHYRSLF